MDYRHWTSDTISQSVPLRRKTFYINISELKKKKKNLHINKKPKIISLKFKIHRLNSV